LPELPEAETIVRGLRRLVSGRVIQDAEVLHADVLTVPTESFRGCVSGHSIDAIERRGKKVVLRLDAGLILVVHLGMTGRLIPILSGGPSPAFLPPHPAIRSPRIAKFIIGKSLFIKC
jgi:formamidopyrimidine-DNA glycosylase